MSASLRLLALLLSVTSVAHSVISYKEGPWTYELRFGKARITGYSGLGGNVVIPSTLGGYEVGQIWIEPNASIRSITSVTIPNSMTSIDSFSFDGWTGLTSVTIPSSVTSIEAVAFSGCTSLTSVTIPSGVKSIGEGAFWYCTSLTSVTIPSSVTSIGAGAFKGCTSLASVTIPTGVTSIEAQVFLGCTSLTSVTIPNSVTSIGENALAGCTSLTSVTIPSGVTSIGESALGGCISLTSVTIPNGVTSIEKGVFFGCDSLTSVTIPSGVTSIGSLSFQSCTSLTSLIIPSSVTSVEAYAFRGSGLKAVYFRGNMPSEKGAIFADITPAGTVYYPRDNTTWGASFSGWPTQPYDLPPPLDKTRPTLSVMNPGSGVLTTTSQRLTLRGTASDNVTPTQIQLKVKSPRGRYPKDWTTVNLRGGNAGTKSWTHPIILTAKGDWSVQIRALDGRGNASAVQAITIRRN